MLLRNVKVGEYIARGISLSKTVNRRFLGGSDGLCAVMACSAVYDIENLTRVVISYEMYETSLRRVS